MTKTYLKVICCGLACIVSGNLNVAGPKPFNGESGFYCVYNKIVPYESLKIRKAEHQKYVDVPTEVLDSQIPSISLSSGISGKKTKIGKVQEIKDLPNVNKQLSEEDLKNHDFGKFYIDKKSFCLGEPLQIISNNGFYADVSKNLYIKPKETKDILIFDNDMKMGGICGVSVYNSGTQPKLVSDCQICGAYQNNAYISRFRFTKIDGGITQESLVNFLGDPDRSKITNICQSYTYIRGNNVLYYKFASNKLQYAAIFLKEEEGIK